MVRIEEEEIHQVGDLSRVPHIAWRRNVEDDHVPEVNAEGEASHGRQQRGEEKLPPKARSHGEKVLEVKGSEGFEEEARPDAAGADYGSQREMRESCDDGAIDQPE